MERIKKNEDEIQKSNKNIMKGKQSKDKKSLSKTVRFFDDN